MMNPIVVSGVAVCYRFLILAKIIQNFPHLVKVLNEIDHNIRTTEFLQQIQRKILIFIIIIFLVSWPFQIYSVLRLNDTSIMLKMIFFFNLYNNFSVFCCEFQFIVFAWIISGYFRQVYDEWRALELGIQRRVASISASKSKDTLNQIKNLSKCQIILCDACATLNHAYNIQLFLSLSTLFINILLNVYFAIFGGYTQTSPTNTKGDEWPNVTDVLNNIIWSCYYTFRFVLICVAAERLTKRANSLKLGISLLIKERPIDPHIKSELWSALTYAVLRKTQFTACNFFKIDLRLITSAVASGTTYLVILAQFHKG